MLYRLMKRLWEQETRIRSEFEDYENFVRVRLNVSDLGFERLMTMIEKSKNIFGGYDLMLWWGDKQLDLYIGEKKALDQLDLDGISLMIN